MIAFAMSSIALVLGEVLAVKYSARLRKRVFSILREDVPAGLLRGEFTEPWFERNLSAVLASIVGIPTLLLTASAYFNIYPDSDAMKNGILVATLGGSIGLGAYGWLQPTAGVVRLRIIGLTVPTFVLLVLNIAGLLLLATTLD